MRLADLSTPALLVEQSRLEHNLAVMQVKGQRKRRVPARAPHRPVAFRRTTRGLSSPSVPEGPQQE